MTTLALLIGLWSTTCIQTQVSGTGQGYAIESYQIQKNGDYLYSRAWFEDAACEKVQFEEVEAGKIKVGSRISGMFITGKTFEVDFKVDSETDLGAISVEADSIKVARGMKNSTMRNTMVGIFKYFRK